MFKESSAPPSVEVIYPHRHSSLVQFFLWPTALAVGIIMGMGAFYGAQSYRHDEGLVAGVTTVKAPEVQTSPSASAYSLLQGSTPSPIDNSVTPETDIPGYATPPPTSKPTTKPLPKPTPKATATSSVKPSPSPSPTSSPTPTPVVVITSSPSVSIP